MHASECDLPADARDGNTVAFEVLYKRYHRLVYDVSRRMLGDVPSAEDVTQNVFLSLWMSPPTFRSGSFDAWLTRVTKNRARDFLRVRTSYRETAFPPDLVMPGLLDDEVHTQLEIARVRVAVAGLPRDQRFLIELGFLGEQSHGEMADLTGLPLGTIKTRIRTGLRKLRGTLDARKSRLTGGPADSHRNRSINRRNPHRYTAAEHPACDRCSDISSMLVVKHPNV